MGSKTLNVRVLYDLKSIKGYAKCVPKEISPDNDPGIYFDKLTLFIDSIISKYEKKIEDEKKMANKKTGKIIRKINKKYTISEVEIPKEVKQSRLFNYLIGRTIFVKKVLGTRFYTLKKYF